MQFRYDHQNGSISFSLSGTLYSIAICQVSAIQAECAAFQIPQYMFVVDLTQMNRLANQISCFIQTIQSSSENKVFEPSNVVDLGCT